MGIHDWTKVDAGIYHDFHHVWLTEIRRLLNAGLLPPSYYALVEQDTGPANPDQLTLQHRIEVEGDSRSGGTVLLLETPPKVRFRQQADLRSPRKFRKRIVVRHISGHSVIAMIELVSPGNKASRKRLRQFIDKCVSLLISDIHLLVIDPFPPSPLDPDGIHNAIWSELTQATFSPPGDKELTLVSYMAGVVPESFVEPITVGDELPPMPLFLSPEKYINVPLAESYSAAWSQVPAFYRDVLASQ